ncbi:hypothetical protein MGYG_08556 [Nannizzia gypsea CBS 118893]|uniref:Uncharacterized protein n=1 Tax=Arthroderma gypseum (strain ATCC MYA-4604 / CBS 118893) TaxID=535722 RepID=E4V615_ARTGP|nr:hypothetical protein MGYG_08556 [Nannizzia gypsea CBS 118893]EFR05540.1 hypothetical protein MGYG_08556 [Nannizzia gypsea CBS 118893]
MRPSERPASVSPETAPLSIDIVRSSLRRYSRASIWGEDSPLYAPALPEPAWVGLPSAVEPQFYEWIIYRPWAADEYNLLPLIVSRVRTLVHWYFCPEGRVDEGKRRRRRTQQKKKKKKRPKKRK